MKHCPHCKIRIGGQAEYCPLCQNPLTGSAQPPYWPLATPQERRLTLLYKVVAFVLLGGTAIGATLDFVFFEAPHPHWSVLLAVWVAALLWLLRVLFYRRTNGPRLLFQLLVVLSLLAVFTDWFVGAGGISTDLIVPWLCSITMVLNFIFAFVRVRFTENALVYLLLNIVIGALPDLLLLFHLGELWAGRVNARSIPWIICFIVSLLTFLGLIIFKGRTLRIELEKRLHM